MKKDNCRDYVCDAFRYYAQCGCPDAEQLRRMRLVATEWQRPELYDLEAVHRVIQKLKTEPDGSIAMRCLELIYFQQPNIVPTRGVITHRVLEACGALSLSESVIYRIMRRLRLMLATERGLRISDTKYCHFLNMKW